MRRDEPGDGLPAVELVQLATFQLASTEYALDIMRIKEIIQPLRITTVPKAPMFIEGVIELRGAIVPVVDLRKRFELPAPPPVRATKYIIVTVDDPAPIPSGRPDTMPGGVPEGRRAVGLVVDAVGEVLRIPRGELGAPPFPRGDAARTFSGVVRRSGRIILVLDIERILSSEERISLAGVV